MNARPARLAFAAAVAVAVLAARASDANAPAGHYTIGAGTVYDTRSRLTWQQTAPAAEHAWADAKTYCASLDLSGTGWRLPTEKELFSLVDRSQVPTIDASAFPGTVASYFWSATLAARAPSYAWAVDFGTGVTFYAPVTSTAYVRCVR